MQRTATPTIDDVAQLAQVSIKTVSRVLNNEANVHPDTRAAVLEAVQRLNYRPKQSARSLAGARSFLIGLLYYDPSAAFVAGVQRGATLACRAAGHHLVVESLDDETPNMGDNVSHMLTALHLDGVILTPPLSDDTRVIAAVNAANTPCVLISPGPKTSMARVFMDEVQAACELTGHLLDLGHTRIACVSGPPAQAASRWRYDGYALALHERGLTPDPALRYEGDFTFDTGVAVAYRMLQSPHPPTAVFAGNDDAALGVLSAALRLGVDVPGELSIVGFDDSPAASSVWPALTTVRQPVEKMAQAAVQMLVRGEVKAASTMRSQGAQPDPGLSQVLAHELVIRQSTAKPKREAKKRR